MTGQAPRGRRIFRREGITAQVLGHLWRNGVVVFGIAVPVYAALGGGMLAALAWQDSARLFLYRMLAEVGIVPGSALVEAAVIAAMLLPVVIAVTASGLVDLMLFRLVMTHGLAHADPPRPPVLRFLGYRVLMILCALPFVIGAGWLFVFSADQVASFLSRVIRSEILQFLAIAMLVAGICALVVTAPLLPFAIGLPQRAVGQAASLRDGVSAGLRAVPRAGISAAVLGVIWFAGVVGAGFALVMIRFPGDSPLAILFCILLAIAICLLVLLVAEVSRRWRPYAGTEVAEVFS